MFIFGSLATIWDIVLLAHSQFSPRKLLEGGGGSAITVCLCKNSKIPDTRGSYQKWGETPDRRSRIFKIIIARICPTFFDDKSSDFDMSVSIAITSDNRRP